MFLSIMLFSYDWNNFVGSQLVERALTSFVSCHIARTSISFCFRLYLSLMIILFCRVWNLVERAIYLSKWFHMHKCHLKKRLKQFDSYEDIVTIDLVIFLASFLVRSLTTLASKTFSFPFPTYSWNISIIQVSPHQHFEVMFNGFFRRYGFIEDPQYTIP